jgi:hypothetical protein
MNKKDEKNLTLTKNALYLMKVKFFSYLIIEVTNVLYPDNRKV